MISENNFYTDLEQKQMLRSENNFYTDLEQKQMSRSVISCQCMQFKRKTIYFKAFLWYVVYII